MSRSLLVVHIWKEIVQCVLESIYGGSLHDVRSKVIPGVEYSLSKEFFSYITWSLACNQDSFFLHL